jgi:hypothetical protein
MRETGHQTTRLDTAGNAGFEFRSALPISNLSPRRAPVRPPIHANYLSSDQKSVIRIAFATPQKSSTTAFGHKAMATADK